MKKLRRKMRGAWDLVRHELLQHQRKCGKVREFLPGSVDAQPFPPLLRYKQVGCHTGSSLGTVHVCLLYPCRKSVMDVWRRKTLGALTYEAY